MLLFCARIQFFRRIRETVSNLVSICYRKLFGIKPAIREDITSPKFLLRVTLHTLGIVILIAAPLQISGLYFDSYFISWLTERGITIANTLDYGTLLAAIIGVGGVFIGLYYTAISSVCSAIYANKPNNIRNLLAQDRVSSFYMDLIAKLTVFSVLLLALDTFGYQPAMLATLLLLFGTGWMIAGFIQLGRRAFNLFDPTTLSNPIFEQLQRCSIQMQARGNSWSDQTLQTQFYEDAQTAIDTLITLADITGEATHLNGRPFADLCQSLLSFLLDYEKGKKSIPTNSLWYRQRYVYPDRYRTYDTEISSNHQSTTGIEPQSISDPRWIESEILPIVRRCLQTNIQNKRYTIVNELLADLDKYVQLIAEEHQVEFAFEVMREVFSSCEEIMLAQKDKPVVVEPLEHMEICKQLAEMPINALTAYERAADSYYMQNKSHQSIDHISWKSAKSIYNSKFAVHVLEQLEWLRPRLIFEERVEGRIITETWYIQELIAQKEAENLRTAMICFYQKAAELYKHWIEIITLQHPWLIAQVISVELEYWNRLDYHMPILEQLWNNLNSNNE